MFGAETILMDRCENEELFRKTVSLINDFKAYFESYHMPGLVFRCGGFSKASERQQHDRQQQRQQYSQFSYVLHKTRFHSNPPFRLFRSRSAAAVQS